MVVIIVPSTVWSNECPCWATTFQ